MTGIIHSAGPIYSPPGYYICVYLDVQEPWPAEFKNGGKVNIEIVPPVEKIK